MKTKTKLVINQHELDLLFRESHEVYEVVSDEVINILKGNDLEKEMVIKRFSDGEIYTFSYVFNTDFGTELQRGIHDSNDVIFKWKKEEPVEKEPEDPYKDKSPEYIAYKKVEDYIESFDDSKKRLNQKDVNQFTVQYKNLKTLQDLITLAHTKVTSYCTKHLINMEGFHYYVVGRALKTIKYTSKTTYKIILRKKCEIEVSESNGVYNVNIDNMFMDLDEKQFTELKNKLNGL